jgi:hypothetical protein
MTEIQIPNNIYNLRKGIEQIQSELTNMGEPISNIPELITSSNLLRSNEYLVKSDQKKTDLISLYAQYSFSMETLLSSVFEIQRELKDILHEQSSLITTSSKFKPKSKPKFKPKSKPKSKK